MSQLDKYFTFVHKDTEDLDMVEANLTIAEDRILSLEACISNPSKMKKTKWCLDALFYFEAELSLENFVKQRRRWNNGTAAGYFLLTRDLGSLWKTKHQIDYLPCSSGLWHLAISFLILCELCKYFIVTITPAIFIVSLRFALGSNMLFGGSHYNTEQAKQAQFYQDAMTATYTGVYIYFAIAHSKTDDNKKDKSFITWAWMLGIVFNALIMLLVFAGMAGQLSSLDANGVPTSAIAQTIDPLTAQLLLFAPVGFILFPIVITFMSAITASVEHSSFSHFSGTGLMIKTFIP